MLHLPNVTLVCYEAVAHEAAAVAVVDCMAAIEFGAVHLWTDNIEAFNGLSLTVRHFPIAPNLSKEAGQAQLWRCVPREVQTSHILNIEWDAGLSDPDMWSDEFLEYDYIGAPWLWHNENRVGNGGFALVSTRLMMALAERPATCPYAFPWDDTLCRRYRPTLEAEGFRWAPEDVAARFSLEHGPLRQTFGFHDCRNFFRILSLRDRMRRQEAANDYVRQHPAWRQMMAAEAYR